MWEQGREVARKSFDPNIHFWGDSVESRKGYPENVVEPMVKAMQGDAGVGDPRVLPFALFRAARGNRDDFVATLKKFPGLPNDPRAIGLGWSGMGVESFEERAIDLICHAHLRWTPDRHLKLGAVGAPLAAAIWVILLCNMHTAAWGDGAIPLLPSELWWTIFDYFYPADYMRICWAVDGMEGIPILMPREGDSFTIKE